MDVIGSLEGDVFPAIGPVPIRDLTAPQILGILRPIEARPAIETAHRIRQRISKVFVYAIASGRGEGDPAAIVQGAMAPLKRGKHPAIKDLGEARVMLAKVEAQHSHPVTKLANRLFALTALRPGTLRTTPWAELNQIGTNSTWLIPSARMKLHTDRKDDAAYDHLVTISRQAVEVIDVLRTLAGNGPLAFPNTRHAHKPMSENAVGYLLNRAGYSGLHCAHGWRTTFSTVMNDRFRADRPIIDLMLAHIPPNTSESAYNRAEHLARRRELSQIWADLILEGAPPAMSLLNGPRH